MSLGTFLPLHASIIPKNTPNITTLSLSLNIYIYIFVGSDKWQEHSSVHHTTSIIIKTWYFENIFILKEWNK